MYKFIVTIALSLMFVTAQAKTDYSKLKYPPGCHQHGYAMKYYSLYLYPEKVNKAKSLYFITNQTNRNITLYQTRKDDADYIIHINHTIIPGRWAVYASDEKEVKFICTKPNKNYKYGEVVDCGEVLRACEFTDVVFGLNNSGNYWVVANNTMGGAIRQSVRHGILLRW